MALLDSPWADPTSPGNGLLALAAAIAPQNQFAQGLLAYGDRVAQGQDRAIARQLHQAQLENYLTEAATRKAALEAAQRKQAALPNLFAGGGMTGGDAKPQEMGGVPMFSQPMGVTPMKAQPAGLNVQAALAAGYTPDEIQKLDALRNVGLNKVARTVKATGPDGKEYEYQMDDFGRPVGAPMPQYRAPMNVNQGNKTTYIDPYTLKPVTSFQTFQSPDSAASVAATIRGQDMTDRRARETADLGAIPSGYRRMPDGTLAFIPGGPADPNAAKKAAPTEFQGKSATFGARAQEADRILNELGTNYSPMGINTKASAARIPLVGGVAEAGVNMSLSDNTQKAEQAQRDFINAVLRQESGAAIGKDEFENARRQYFPEPGDTPGKIAQKARNRALVISGFRANSRPGGVDEVLGGAGAGASGAPAINPNDPLGLRR